LGFPTGWSFTTHKDCLLPHSPEASISILTFFSLGGFRYSGGQINRKRPFFGKRRK
jgi:hypothetical protein